MGIIEAVNESEGLSVEIIKENLEKSINNRRLNKVLLIPPDITRSNSGAGLITSLYYELLGGRLYVKAKHPRYGWQ